ncbi:MAG: TIGR03643 family protein [Bacteroidetes bacterium]|nr:TIGR03643 family protein [Bacteroidota bacterium]
MESLSHLTPEKIDRIIEMAWEDRTPFDAIFTQFGLKENAVRAIMRKELKRTSFIRWRIRVKSRVTKHLAQRDWPSKGRFKSANQRQRP